MNNLLIAGMVRLRALAAFKNFSREFPLGAYAVLS